MGEYSREQRNQLSRVIANSETGSRQMKGFMDNRRGTNKPVQYKKNMLECTTEIKVLGKQSTTKGTGKNNPDDRAAILSNIRGHKETAWIADIPKQKGGNEPGTCAEPHSLSAALSKIRSDDKIENVVQSSTKFVLTPDGNAKKNGYKKGDIYPPCKTCEQWVPKLHEIKSDEASTSQGMKSAEDVDWTDFADVAD